MNPSPQPSVEIDPLATVPIGVLRMRFEGPTRGPPATLWRSALGRALREAVCVTDQTSCGGCLLHKSCAYPRLFEPESPSRDRPFGTSSPPPTPYSLYAEATPNAMRLQLRLFGGWALGAAPLLLSALTRAGQRGLGRERRRYILAGVESLTAAGTWRSWNPVDLSNSLPTPQLCPARTGVILMSPLRLQRAGRILSANEITARDFGLALLRRIQLLAWAHGEGPTPTPPLHALDRLRLLRVEVHHRSGMRYSARQRQTVPLDGLVGRFEVEGAGLPSLWRWLWTGQWTQIGKGTTQGLGAYQLRAVSDPASLP